MAANPERVLQRFSELQTEFNALVDTAPERAVEAVRCLEADDLLDEFLVSGLRGGVLVDAGRNMGSQEVVAEGTELLRELTERHPERIDLRYSLANGLVAGADLAEFNYPEWSLRTSETRREARQMYWAVASQVDDPDLKAKSLTNLGNALLRGYREIEAYDYYMSALTHDPANGVALTGAAKILLRFADAGWGNKLALRAVAAKYLESAKQTGEKLRDLGGGAAYDELQSMLASGIEGGEMPDLSSASNYARFVARYRLALSPTLEGLDVSVQKWDTLRFPTIIEPLDDESGVPPIFAMFNTLKSDYLAARLIAYQAITSEVDETGRYFDSLDYAVYGVPSSLLTLAQRACYDLLDKVAVATTHYLGIEDDPRSVKFVKRWATRGSGGSMKWQPDVASEISAGTTALIALSEVAGDVEKGGFLYEKRELRHSSTHRFTVLHDIATEPSRECNFVEHYNIREFRGHVIKTLGLARASLVYFVGMILQREARLEKESGPLGRLSVPDHDAIRGRE